MLLETVMTVVLL